MHSFGASKQNKPTWVEITNQSFGDTRTNLTMDEMDSRKRLRTSGETMENMNLYRDSKMEQILTEAVRIAYTEGFNLNPDHFARIDRLHYLGDEGTK